MRMNERSEYLVDRCDTLLAACDLLCIHAICMKSRLMLDMPVTIDMGIIESDIDDIIRRFAELGGKGD